MSISGLKTPDSFDEDARAVIESLINGIFFRVHVEGIRVMRTILSKWVDEHTQDKRLLHLFKKGIRGLRRPSPKQFALRIKGLGWWTAKELFAEEMPKYVDRVEDMKARLMKQLALPEFYERFKKVASHMGLSAEEVLRRINIRIPCWVIRVIYLSEVAKDEIVESYRREINRRVKSLIGNLKVLLTSGLAGRKIRVNALRKELVHLTILNSAKYNEKFIHDLARTFEAVRDLNRGALPDLTQYLGDDNLPEAIKREIRGLINELNKPLNWRLK